MPLQRSCYRDMVQSACTLFLLLLLLLLLLPLCWG
jgi:hypothetical protein